MIAAYRRLLSGAATEQGYILLQSQHSQLEPFGIRQVGEQRLTQLFCGEAKAQCQHGRLDYLSGIWGQYVGTQQTIAAGIHNVLTCTSFKLL